MKWSRLLKAAAVSGGLLSTAGLVGVACTEAPSEPISRSVGQRMSAANCTGPSVNGECVEGETLFGVVLPPQQTRDSIGIHAFETLQIDDRVVVEKANGSPATLVNTGDDGQTNIGSDARIGTLFSDSPVTLRDRARVTGDVLSEASITEHNQVVVTGNKLQNTEIEPKVAETWSVTFEGGSDVHLEPDRFQALAPGHYGALHVKSRSTIELSGGAYFFDSFFLEPQAVLKLNMSDLPVLLFIKGGFIFRGSIQKQGIFDALFSHFGQSNARLEAPFTGTLVSPNATIDIESVNGAPHRGAFFGKNVHVFPGAKIIHVPFESWSELNVLEEETLGTAPPLTYTTTAGSPPSLDGPAPVPERVDAFLDWIRRATVSDRTAAAAVIDNVQGDEAIGSEVAARFAPARDERQGFALMVLAVLGHLQTHAGEQLFLNVLAEPEPNGANDRSERGSAAQNRHLSYQVKAVQGLGVSGTAAANAALLDAIGQHPAYLVRREAVRTFRLHHPGVDLSSAVRPDELDLLDRFENRDTEGGPTFAEKLNQYLALHPQTAGN